MEDQCAEGRCQWRRALARPSKMRGPGRSDGKGQPSQDFSDRRPVQAQSDGG